MTAAELGVLLADLTSTTSPSAEIIGTRRPEELRSVFGDVIVSEGVDAALDGWTLVGDRTTELARVPRLAGDAAGRSPGQNSVRRSAPAQPGAG